MRKSRLVLYLSVDEGIDNILHPLLPVTVAFYFISLLLASHSAMTGYEIVSSKV